MLFRFLNVKDSFCYKFLVVFISFYVYKDIFLGV